MMDKTEVTKARVYLASPFFSPQQSELLDRVEQALENNPFVEAYFSPRKSPITSLQFGSEIWRDATFNLDIDNLDWATHVVAVADFDGADADSGTAFELGYAYATGKPVILLHESDTIVNLMLSEGLHYYTKDVNDIEDYNFLKMPKKQYKGEII